MKESKVYGGSAFVDGKQVRVIVRATTKKEAITILNKKGLGITNYYFNGWWGETSNHKELTVCKIGEVWYQKKHFTEYIKLSIPECE